VGQSMRRSPPRGPCGRGPRCGSSRSRRAWWPLRLLRTLVGGERGASPSWSSSPNASRAPTICEWISSSQSTDDGSVVERCGTRNRLTHDSACARSTPHAAKAAAASGRSHHRVTTALPGQRGSRSSIPGCRDGRARARQPDWAPTLASATEAGVTRLRLGLLQVYFGCFARLARDTSFHPEGSDVGGWHLASKSARDATCLGGCPSRAPASPMVAVVMPLRRP
jgi:hypothetical protein